VEFDYWHPFDPLRHRLGFHQLIAMSLTFPPAPTLNELFPSNAVAGQKQWQFDGLIWRSVLAAPPAFDNTRNPATTEFVQSALVQSGPLAGLRNIVMNGDFYVWQRVEPRTLRGKDEGYLPDRWWLGCDQAGRNRVAKFSLIDVSQVGFSTETALRWEETTAGSAYTFKELYQGIEGIHHFAGQQAVMSFRARAGAALTLPTIDFGQHFGTGTGASPDVLTNIARNVPITTAWQRFAFPFTVPSIAGKTYGSDSHAHSYLRLRLPPGSTFMFDITEVMIEPGRIATPFETRPAAVELQMCKRYYEHNNASNNVWMQDGWAYADGVIVPAWKDAGWTYFYPRFRVEKFYEPSVRIWDAAGALGKCSFERPGDSSENGLTPQSVGDVTPIGFRVGLDNQDNGAYVFCNWEAEAEL
jgi:hypothetical protein